MKTVEIKSSNKPYHKCPECSDFDHMKEVHRMATESLDPENFAKIVDALNQMAKNRNIEDWNEVF